MFIFCAFCSASHLPIYDAESDETFAKLLGSRPCHTGVSREAFRARYLVLKARGDMQESQLRVLQSYSGKLIIHMWSCNQMRSFRCRNEKRTTSQGHVFDLSITFFRVWSQTLSFGTVYLVGTPACNPTTTPTTTLATSSLQRFQVSARPSGRS